MSDFQPIAPPPHLLKKFSAQAQEETRKRNGAGYLKTFAILCIKWFVNCQSTSNDRQIRSSEIQPPTGLVMNLVNNHYGGKVHRDLGGVELSIATQAAQWGADQELDACCTAIDEVPGGWADSRHLRHVRRPKPPSLKKQALAAQQRMWDGTSNHDDWNLIRRAL